MEQKKVKHFTLTNDGYQMVQKLCDTALRAEGLSSLKMVTELLQNHLKPELEEDTKE